MQWLIPVFAASLVFGVVVGDVARPVGAEAWAMWPALVVAGCGALAWGIEGLRRRPHVLLAWVGVWLGFGLHVGGGTSSAGLEGWWGREGGVFDGEVVSGARPGRDGRTRVEVALSRCGAAACAGRVLAMLPEGGPVLATGDRARLIGRLEAPEGADASYLFDAARWMARRGLVGRVVVGRQGGYGVIRRGGGAGAALDRFRWSRERRVLTEVGGDEAGFLLALVTGSRGTLTSAARRPVDDAGLSHLLAISGLHLLTVGGVVLLGFGWLEKRRPRLCARPTVKVLGRLLPILLVAAYGTLAGWPVSALRAVIMFVAWSAASWVGRRSSLHTGLGLAVAGNLLVDSTHAVFDPGLHLSIGAVVGLVMATEGVDFGKGARGFALGSLAVSAGSTAACAPFTLLNFGRLPAVGLVLNLAAVPLVQFFVLPVGLVGFVFADTEVGIVGCRAAAWALGALRQVASVTPLSGVDLGVASVGVLLASLGVAAWASVRRPRWGLAVVLAGSVLSGLVPQPAVEARFLPVGQGDAILIRDELGHAVLIDAGGSATGDFDPGARVVRPALLSLGVRRLDVLVASHSDLDHIGGMVEVIRTFKPRELWWSAPQGDGRLVRRVLETAAATGTVVREAPERAEFGSVVLRRIDRPAPAHLLRQVDTNERSLVLVATVGEASVLLAGDVEHVGEWRMLPEVTPVTVLKAAHHGSRTSSTPSFLARACPSTVVIQSGRGNRFGHPHPDVVARLVGRGAEVLDTSACGEIVIGVQEGSAFVATHRRCDRPGARVPVSSNPEPP